MKKFIIQLSMYNHSIENYVKGLKAVGASYQFFSLISGESLLDNFPEDFDSGDYISFSGIKALKISQSPQLSHFVDSDSFEKNWASFKASYFYRDPERFDQAYYSQLGLPLVNNKSSFLNMADSLDLTFDNPMFIKPSSDLKAFNGGIIQPFETISEFIHRTPRQHGWETELFLASPVKDIHSEYRFFIVNDEVVTGSRYMVEGTVSPDVNIPEDVLKKAIELAKVYCPDIVFTMDLALLKNGEIEIMEYNCFNTSGTYFADMPKLFERLVCL